ncbi:aminoglycoside phosphotransferase family protein [Isoptericola croceus]|uniref:aminoglycoside phosphotransferase family protein n=1 Tax=Isoptericola croceus TaxID=3031406 RepID=UPI0023F99F4A|nr:aminoglycoside phosphotransferase family protein [Isoptericola croceus]
MTVGQGDEVELAGGNVGAVVRVGDTVRRTAGPWTPTIHALLAWVRARGASMVPVPLGIDDGGREVLSFLPGEVAGWPVPAWVWEPETAQAAGTMLRTWHDATEGFALQDATWRVPPRDPVEVVCLNDIAPYNMVHDGNRLVGLIDIDMASPGPRVWDLAYLAYRICGWCEDMPAPTGSAPRAVRLDLLLDAYGRDAAPSTTAVMSTMRQRLHDLADWTDEHARTTGATRLLEHAAMYRRDATRL